jgi:hypothetical protein
VGILLHAVLANARSARSARKICLLRAAWHRFPSAISISV